nr:GNAT family N-acetyltransferase [uncultured Actinoplanes sp.]
MDRAVQQHKAGRFRTLYEEDMLVLPHARDVGSALLFQRVGARAIATTGAEASRRGGRDGGQRLTRAGVFDLVAKIVDKVDVPVSADVGSGCGPEPHAVADTVHDVVNAGAIGIELGDSRNTDGALFSCDDQAARIMAARDAAARAGLAQLVINARSDVFLLGDGPDDGRVEDVLNRALAYDAAGADMLFVPGLTDLEIIKTIVRRSPIPVNVMVGPGSPPLRQLADAGVRCVSVGDAPARAAYTAAARAAEELLAEGSRTSQAAGIWAGINDAFTGLNEPQPPAQVSPVQDRHRREGTTTDPSRNLDDVVISHDVQNRKYDANYGDDGIGVVVYEQSMGHIIITHAAVHESHRGYGVGNKLIGAALDHIQTLGLPVRVRCPVVRSFIDRNPRYAPLMNQS